MRIEALATQISSREMRCLRLFLLICSAFLVCTCGSVANQPKPETETEKPEQKRSVTIEPVEEETTNITAIPQGENTCIPQDIVDEITSCPEHLTRCPEPLPKRPVRQVELALCRLEIPSGAVLDDLSKTKQSDLLLALMDGLKNLRSSSQASESEIEACESGTLALVWERIELWFAKFMGNESDSSPRDPEKGRLLHQVLAALLDTFPQIDNVPLPEKVLTLQPTKYRLLYYLGNVAWHLEEWRDCRDYFSHVVDIDLCGEYSVDAVYAAYLCWYKPKQSLDVARTIDPRLSTIKVREFTEQELLEDNFLRRAICVLDTAKMDGRAKDRDVEYDLVNLKYRRAMLHRSAGKFWEATALFREMAFTHYPVSDASYRLLHYFELLEYLIWKVEPGYESCRRELEYSIKNLLLPDTEQGRFYRRDGELRQFSKEVLRKLEEDNSE